LRTCRGCAAMRASSTHSRGERARAVASPVRCRTPRRRGEGDGARDLRPRANDGRRPTLPSSQRIDETTDHGLRAGKSDIGNRSRCVRLTRLAHAERRPRRWQSEIHVSAGPGRARSPGGASRSTTMRPTQPALDRRLRRRQTSDVRSLFGAASTCWRERGW
jgi:hypothetical protein